ncbi:hypothetical protein D5086_031558 [Populus alba]|uniref:Uncharacterized protein n=1 Tax=Populus alba TaxID=43335 RepID=A0ACC4AIW2_POPAL
MRFPFSVTVWLRTDSSPGTSTSCSNNADMVICKLVPHGDTLLTICSRFRANTAILNRLDNPGRIRYFVYPKTSKLAWKNDLFAARVRHGVKHRLRWWESIVSYDKYVSVFDWLLEHEQELPSELHVV